MTAVTVLTLVMCNDHELLCVGLESKQEVKDDASDNGDGSDTGEELKTPQAKRSRMRFTPSQIKVLEKRFQKQHYLLPSDRKYLAMSLQMTERQVKTWFQNKRAQYKRTRPLIRNPVYHHLGPSNSLSNHLQKHTCDSRFLHLCFPYSPAINPCHTLTSPTFSTTLSPHFLSMPMAYAPVPITTPK